MTTDEEDPQDEKPIFWVGSSQKDIRELPQSVRRGFGQALFDAQTGKKHPDAKPLKGFGGAGVLEIVENDDGKTYRAVYTVKFAGVVYVLHVFQKKSKAGIKTPDKELAKIQARLKEAESHYARYHTERKDRESHGDGGQR